MARQIEPIPSGCARSRSKQCRMDTNSRQEKQSRTKKRKTETHDAASKCASTGAQNSAQFDEDSQDMAAVGPVGTTLGDTDTGPPCHGRAGWGRERKRNATQ